MNELTSHASAVHAFYLAFLGRPADPDGLAYWSARLAANESDLSAIAASFAHSEEAQDRFGDDTPAERIAEIYQQLFSRAPDAGGLAFWSDAIGAGHVSLADVAITILDAAQGTDADLVELRKQAAVDFTAQVAESGSNYAGDAALEAAGVLMRAVTLGASQDDIDQLVQATVAFTDIASSNPKVVEAIATGTTLLALFDTERGAADPVTLAQALADMAKAAADDPSALAALQRHGGMAKVLDKLPARASLQDVVDAVAKGGLDAVIDIVDPPRPTPPAPTPPVGVTLKFAGVDHDANDRTPDDNVTNAQVADVRFSFSGTPATGQKFQYRLDAEADWTDIAPVGKTITVTDVDLTASPAGTNVQVRLVNADGSAVTAIDQDIVHDATPPTERLAFLRIEGQYDGAVITTKETVDVSFSVDQRDDGILQWRMTGSDAWIDVEDDAGAGTVTLKGIDLTQNDPTIEVRAIDAAGNIGESAEVRIDGPGGIDIGLGIRWVRLNSPFDGEITLESADGSFVVESNHATKGAAAGVFVDITEQQTLMQGTLTVTSAQDETMTTGDNYIYTFGSAAGEKLTGSMLWGFGGDDTLTGTSDSYNLLSGGAGNDTIYANGGENTISGGLGADTIILTADGIQTLFMYNVGEALSGVFASGDSIAELDRITNAEAGDIFFASYIDPEVAVVSDTFLTTGELNQAALVRGDIVADTFVANTGGEAWMMQWTDEVGINSVVFTNFAGGTPGLDLQFGTLDLVDLDAGAEGERIGLVGVADGAGFGG